MPIAVDSMRAEMAQEYATRCLFASLHTVDPGQTGSDELAGIVRQAITWNVGDADGEIVSDSITFTLSAPAYVSHIGLWSGLSGGTFRDSLLVAADLPAGDYIVALSYTQT